MPEPITPDPATPDPATADPAAPEPGSARTPRGRRSALTQVVVAVLLAALGFAAVAQVRLTQGDDDFSGQRREDLIELLDSLAAASDRSREQIAELEQTRADLQSSSDRRRAAIEDAQDRLEVLEILSGTVPAVGPGVTITVQDPAGAVRSDILLDAIEELRDAGAEAIEIKNEVRVVASTSFTDVDGVIYAGDVELRPPFVIDVIGASHTLSEAVIFPGGLRDGVEQAGGSLTVTEEDTVEVGSLHTVRQPEYSQPSGG